MQLCEIEIPGLQVAPSIRPVRAALRRQFPNVSDVLPTTRPDTILVIFEGDDSLEEWALALDHVRRSTESRALPRRGTWRSEVGR